MFAEVRLRVRLTLAHHSPLAGAKSKHIQFAFGAFISLLSPGVHASGTDNTAELMRLPVTELPLRQFA